MSETPSQFIDSKSLVVSSTAVPASSAPAGYRLNAPSPGLESDPNGSFIEYWRILRRRKGSVVLIAAIGLLAGILVTVPQTPVYQARASVEVQNLNENFMNMNQVSPVSENNSYNALFDIQTQIRILQSETLLDRVIDRLKTSVPAEPAQPSRFEVWSKALNLPDADSKLDPRTIVLKRIAKNIRVRSAGQTRIIEVLSESTNPALAARFSNTLVQEFIDQNMEARWKMTQRTGEWLTRQLDDMRLKLERSEDALQAYARQAGIIMTGDDKKENVTESKLRQLQEELSKAQADRVSKQSRNETAKAATIDTLADVLNDSSLRNYQEKLTDLRRQQAELSTTYTADHAKVIRVAAQIESLNRALERERSMILGRIANDYDEAVRRESLLTSAYQAQSRLVTDQAEKGIQYSILKREVETNRQLYESMMQRVRESSIASALRASNIRVVDNAKIPPKPASPSYPFNAGIGLVSGALIGFAFVITSERVNRTLREPGDAAFYLGVPELGHIPSAMDKGVGIYRYIASRGRSADSELVPASDRVALPDIPELTTYRRRSSMAAEAFRAVLTSMLFTDHEGRRPRIITITSANPREGKTTVVTNIALALAEVNQRVLVIDADLRKPRLQYVFSMDNEYGLVNLLHGRTYQPGQFRSLVRETPIPNLSVMLSGPPTNAAANLLYSPALPQLLAEVAEHFDTVIIDTPPMLQMPDARIVGNLTDGVVLVTRGGVTTKDASSAACARLRTDRINILGAVLNDWNPTAAPSGYYGYYKYNASYSYSATPGKD